MVDSGMTIVFAASMLEPAWVDYPQLQPIREIAVGAEDDAADDEPPILHRFGDDREDSHSVSVRIVETPSTFLSELMERAKAKVLSMRSHNDADNTPKIPSLKSAFKPVSSLENRLQELLPETETQKAAVPCSKKTKTVFRKITKEESDLMGREKARTELQEALPAKERSESPKPFDASTMTVIDANAAPSVSEMVLAAEEVSCEAKTTPEDDHRIQKSIGRPRGSRKSMTSTSEPVLLPVQRSRRSSTVANTEASKAFHEMIMSKRMSRRKRNSSHNSDAENEMSPAAKYSPSSMESLHSSLKIDSPESMQDPVDVPRKRKPRGKPSQGKKTGSKKVDEVASPKVINEACPWEPVGEPVAMNIQYQNDQKPKARLCYSTVRHKKMGETFSAYDVVSVGIEGEVEGRVEKSTGIAKVSCFFYDDNGNLMINLFWYYSPEDANITGKKYKKTKEEDDPLPQFHERELLASKHVDVVPVEAIEGRAYVLSFSEYNRFVAECVSDSFPAHVRSRREQICPLTMDDYPNERALPPELSPDNVYFSRHAYNFAHHRLFVGPAFRKFQPWGRTRKLKNVPNRAF
ncbi:hypothetical protein QR680_005458 [Steinernema hermaphroditum]|uniref:BAH domain-containing protein n=1 Tax=Steinernema hermaphroditum TaxID=289476 RepID=A0AA39LVE0_9BILA|nr:hypothetical protein QR680_005458 [Steinernema hermaphroditum]